MDSSTFSVGLIVLFVYDATGQESTKEKQGCYAVEDFDSPSGQINEPESRSPDYESEPAECHIEYDRKEYFLEQFIHNPALQVNGISDTF